MKAIAPSLYWVFKHWFSLHFTKAGVLMTAKGFPEASGVNTGAKGLILGIKIPE